MPDLDLEDLTTSELVTFIRAITAAREAAKILEERYGAKDAIASVLHCGAGLLSDLYDSSTTPDQRRAIATLRDVDFRSLHRNLEALLSAYPSL